MRDKIVKVSDKVKGLRSRSKRNIAGFKQAAKEYGKAKYPVSRKEGFKAGGRFYKELAKGSASGLKAGVKGAHATGKAMKAKYRKGFKKAGGEYHTWAKSKGGRSLPRRLVLSKSERANMKGKKKAMFKAAFAQHEVTREEVIAALVEVFMSE
jgi:hypothetical protein